MTIRQWHLTRGGHVDGGAGLLLADRPAGGGWGRRGGRAAGGGRVGWRGGGWRGGWVWWGWRWC